MAGEWALINWIDVERDKLNAVNIAKLHACMMHSYACVCVQCPGIG